MAPWQDDPTPKFNGDYDSATRAPKPPARTVLADVVGDDLAARDGTPLPLGAIFGLVDLAAGKCSPRERARERAGASAAAVSGRV